MAVIGWTRHHSSRFLGQAFGKGLIGSTQISRKNTSFPHQTEKKQPFDWQAMWRCPGKRWLGQGLPGLPSATWPSLSLKGFALRGLSRTWDLELGINPCAAGNLGCTWICWGLILGFLGFLGDSDKTCMTLSRLRFLVVFVVLPVNVFRYLLTKRRALQSCDT